MPTISIKDVGKWTDNLRDELMKEARSACIDAAKLGVRNIKGVIIPAFSHPPVNRGIYRAGWNFEPTDKGARVFNRTYPQAPLIEYGVRAENVHIGRAMLSALAEWATMKGIDFGKGAQATAWAIAKSMQKRGIFNEAGAEGFHIIDKAIPAMLEEVRAAFARRVAKRRSHG